MRTLPLAEVKAKLSGLIDDVARRDERVTITKRGRPIAVLMSHDEAAGIDATLEIMSDPVFYAEILRNRAALDAGRGGVYDDLNELFGEEVPRRGKPTPGPAARKRGRFSAPSARNEAKGPRSARGAAKRPRSR